MKPRNYYNEFDPKAAAWLRELIAAGLIPPGDVDERSITEVKPNEIKHYCQHHFFAGIGGFSLALRLAGWPEDRPIVTGSCPCQSFSSAGQQKGVGDHRDLWPVFAAIIRELRPATAIGEQVASAIRFGWLDRVRTDLEAEGYAVGGIVLGAHSVSAPHIRQRLYWLAESQEQQHDRRGDTRGRWGEFANSGDVERLANPVQRGQRGGDERGLGTPGREMGEHQDGPGAANESRHGCQDAEWVGDTSGNGSAAGLPGQEPGKEGQPGVSDNTGGEASRDGGGGVEHTGLNAGCAVQGDERSECDSGTWQPSPWSDTIWLPCRDGKARRVPQSGLRLLVAGLPRGVVPSGDPSEQEAQNSAEARVMRLRGYGNSITVQVAAEFIKAYLNL